MQQAIGQMLPLALGVGLSPIPIVAIVLVLGTPRARVNGPAFLLGWVVGLSLVGVLVLVFHSFVSASENDAPATWVSLLQLVLGALLLVLAVRQWRGRNAEKDLPKWMQAIDAFTAAKTFGIGVLLSAANPKNLVLTAAAAAAIAATGIDPGQETIALAIFVLLGTIGVGGPVVLYFVLGERSRRPLEALNSWMAANNTVIMAVLLLIIGAKLFGDGIAGL